MIVTYDEVIKHVKKIKSRRQEIQRNKSLKRDDRLAIGLFVQTIICIICSIISIIWMLSNCTARGNYGLDFWPKMFFYFCVLLIVCFGAQFAYHFLLFEKTLDSSDYSQWLHGTVEVLTMLGICMIFAFLFCYY